MSRIDILLATYNGAPFILEQLRSLEGQTHRNWRLLVRDDGSSDGTPDIVRAWANDVEQGIDIIEDGRKGLGAAQNFAALLARSDSPYFAFCDQDDVWLPHKLEMMLQHLQGVEATRGMAVPVLCYSDLAIVDAQLRRSGRTFWETSRIDPQRYDQSLLQGMVRNFVTGCATLGNAALRESALPIPTEARMHDAWLSLVAIAFGVRAPIAEPTVLYRLHGTNAVGLADFGSLALLRGALARPAGYWERVVARRENSRRVARAFIDIFGDRLGRDQVRILERYASLRQENWWRRRAFLARQQVGGDNLFLRLALTALG